MSVTKEVIALLILLKTKEQKKRVKRTKFQFLITKPKKSQAEFSPVYNLFWLDMMFAILCFEIHAK